MKTIRTLKKQAGFFFQLQIMGAMFFLSIFTAAFVSSQQTELEMRLDNQQGQSLSTLIHAVKIATTQTTALDQWNVAGAPFENGAVHIGSTWLKQPVCGGPQPDEYLFCDFQNEPQIGDDMQYRSEVSNDGIQLNVQVTVSNTAGTRGFDFNGTNGIRRSCAIARVAAGGLSNVGFSGAMSNVGCDQDTGVITFNVAWNSTTSEDLSIRGLNSPLVAIPWGGQNLNDMNQLEVSTIVDREAPVFNLDLDGTSTLNTLTADTLNATTGNIDNLTSNTGAIDTLTGTDLTYDNLNGTALDVDTGTIGTATINTAINQLDSNEINNFAGGVAVGTGPNISTIENGSIYLPGAIVAQGDNSMFFDPAGVSRTQDIRLTSRGGVSLSNLTPNYVHKGSVTIYGQGPIDRVNCGDGAGIAANRLVVNWEDQRTSIAASGKLASNYAYNRVRVQSNSSKYFVQLLSYNYQAKAWQVTNNNRALLTLYCFYP
ncbi:hypothetical protein F7Q91_03395 [Vibrio chagasii]|uniref:Uncharacterized protein n=1 Tax=Vibrio chagasii TaxID=170679 RepID=A0A7V7TKB2_9VIBR|nr:hypothetical protein [Vibrio chagasii]KAB0482467.1 hypothetical protein F7Q91_03395 [Vibrio chagasii]